MNDRITATDAPCRDTVPADARHPAIGIGPHAYCHALGHAAYTDHAASGTPLAALGRRRVLGGPYCDAHGGAERARAEVRRDWAVVAPDAVGDDAAVLDAGCWTLGSEHACVTVGGPDARGRWLAWRGIGSHLVAVAPPGVRERRAAIMAHYAGVRRGARRRARAHAPMTFGSAAEAAACAEVERRTACAAEADAIRAARGGTLAWGLAIRPRPVGVVHRLPAIGGSAWDAPDHAADLTGRGEGVMAAHDHRGTVAPAPPAGEDEMIQTVVTYRLAYVSGTRTLCAEHAERPSEDIPALGPVSIGARRGACDVCDVCERSDGRPVVEDE